MPDASIVDLCRQPLPLSRPRAMALARPELEPALRDLLLHEQLHVRRAACLILGLLGSEESVDALLAYFHESDDHDALTSLLECGARGREQIAEMCLSSTETADLALEVVLDGLRRPPYRGALMGILRQTARRAQDPENRLQAARNLLLSAWQSGAEELLELPGGRDLLARFPFPPLFPAPQTAEQRIRQPYFAELDHRISLQIADAGRRGRQAVEAYREELERRQARFDEPGPKVGRNEPCPCGSGKKFKKCCLQSVEAAQRADPWVMAEEVGPFLPYGLLALPMHHPDGARLLEILREPRPGRLRLQPQDGAVVAWTLAFRLFQFKEWERCGQALQRAFLEQEPDGLDVDVVLTTMVTTLLEDRPPPAFHQLLLQLMLRHGRESHMQLAGETFSSHPEGVLQHVDDLLNRGASLAMLMAFADGVLQQMSFPELADELADVVPVFYPDDPTAEQALAELRERAEAQLEEEGPFPDPHAAVGPLVEVAEFAALCPLEELSQTAERLLHLLSWPRCLMEGSEDSRPALEAELAARRRLQGEHALRLQERADAVQQRSLTELEAASRPLLCLAPRRALWFLPASLAEDEAQISALEAERMARELDWGKPSVLSTGLSWNRPGGEAFVYAALTPGPDVLTFPLGLPACPGPDPVEAPPRPHLQGIPLDDDPVPARKALRRVLRRLLRMNKVGEAHTAIELVTRGVRGHLRGDVQRAVERLLQQGILRNKPTLKGLHTSIEPKHVPAVTRFIEAGTVLLPGLFADG